MRKKPNAKNPSIEHAFCTAVSDMDFGLTEPNVIDVTVRMYTTFGIGSQPGPHQEVYSVKWLTMNYGVTAMKLWTKQL